MEKSANKKWKDAVKAGTTSLSFKEWIDRENKKNEETFNGNFIPFDGDILDMNSLKARLNESEAAVTRKIDTIGQIDTSSIDKTMEEAKSNLIKSSGYKTTSDASTIFGLNKGVLLFSTLLIAGSLTYYFYDRYKKK